MKHDLKSGGIPKNRKKVGDGQVALRGRDPMRQIAKEHEITILSGKVATDQIHVLVAYRPHVEGYVQAVSGSCTTCRNIFSRPNCCISYVR